MAVQTVDVPQAKRPPEERWPGVEFAYDFVRPSYEIMLRRAEIVENRVRGILTIGATLMFAVPVLVRSSIPPSSAPMLSSYSWIALVAAALCLVAALWLGMKAHMGGRITVYSPKFMYDEMLDMDEWHFKHSAVASAADAFSKHVPLVNRKAKLSEQVGLAVILEVLCLVAWAVIQSV